VRTPQRTERQKVERPRRIRAGVRSRRHFIQAAW
jgi:hypothetical protein